MNALPRLVVLTLALLAMAAATFFAQHQLHRRMRDLRAETERRLGAQFAQAVELAGAGQRTPAGLRPTEKFSDPVTQAALQDALGLEKIVVSEAGAPVSSQEHSPWVARVPLAGPDGKNSREARLFFAPPPATRLLAACLQWFTFALAVAAGLLLVFGLALPAMSRRAGPGDGPPPSWPAAAAEMAGLTGLAKFSASQGAALAHERETRQRAEEDLHLKQVLLNQALAEKISLGRDLHDGIIQSLYALGLGLESTRPLLPADPPEADRRLARSVTALNEIIRDMRNFIMGLGPEALQRQTFARALTALAESLREGRAVRFEFDIEEEAAALLTPEQALPALQIVREAVSNSLRHGCAGTVTIRLRRGDRQLALLVQDDGAGFDLLSPHARGHGLNNTVARAAQLGAKLQLTSTPGAGTRVLLTIPVVSPA